MLYTLDELLQAMEPQAQKDKALAARCIDGLTQYAAELRQRGGPEGQAKLPALRELVGQLPTYWGLKDEPDGLDESVCHAAFDLRIAEAAATATPLEATGAQRSDTVYGLYRYAMDLILNLGVDAQADIEGCRDLIRELETWWDFGSPVLDGLCAEIDQAMAAQAAREAEFDATGADGHIQDGGMAMR